MIYLNRETQEQVLKIFHFALHETGYLFLGSSETADSAPKHFTPVDKKQRIYRCRPSNASWNMPPPLPLPGVWMPKMPEQPLETHNNLQSFGELHHRLIEYYAPPSILINEEGDILHLSENAGRFLRFVGGEPSANIIKAIHPALLSDVRAALFTARKEKKTVEAKNIRVQFNGDASTGSATEKLVNITVRPVGTPEAAALIMFEENTGEPPAEESMQAIIAGDQAMETVVRRMEEELHHTKDRLRNTVEQYETSTEELKASNEELQAINEELRSTAEELETSKEELQSVNEELITVNNELKEKVEEVGHANSDLENLMRSTDIATIFLDRGLNIKRYTPRVTDIFNLIPSDAGRPLSHITHRLSPDNFQKDAAKVLQSLQPMEREVRSEDGRAFIVRFSPYRTLDDKIDGVVISFIDITEREKAEQRIKDERAYAEAIISTVRGPIIVLDKNLRVVSANRSFYKSFKVSPEESEEKFIYDLGNRQWDIPKLRDLLENILPEKNEFQDFEVEHKFEKIGQRTMLLNAREIIRTDGIERLILLAFEDITERKKTEQALRESEENYRVMVNQAVAGILKTDRSGNIIFTNDQFEKMMGYTAEELLQMNIAGLVHEKDREHHTEMFETMQKGGEGYMIEKRLERKDGYYIWVNNYNAPIFAGDGSLRSVAIVSVDITDQKAIEKQKDDFIGIASHELKTPLTSIKACTELLQEVFAEDEETQNDSLVKTLNGQVDRLTRLVSDLLDTTRITGSQLDLKQETFDLNKLIEECVGEAQLTTSKHQLIIKPGDVSPLHADRERIGQVIINLLTNAIKYSPDANQVIIFSENIDNKEVKISVHDFGIGVGPEVQQKIFKRFYQAKTSDKSSSGLGLGLYISMQIIKSHGGEMGVESQPGKGSIFYFRLPYELNKKHPA
jgi:two-component system CheB/CheR fusion protein